MSQAKAVLQGLLLVAGVWLAVETAYTIHKDRPLLHDALWNVRSVTWNISETSATLQANSTATFTLEKKILGEASELIKLTNVNVYGKSGHPGLIPRLTSLVTNADSSMVSLNTMIGHLDRLTAAGTGTVEELTETVKMIRKDAEDLDSIIADPRIKQELGELLQVTQDIDLNLKQLNLMLKSGTATAEDIQAVADKLREEYTKARNIWWGIVKEFLPLAGSAAQVVK